jgi:hypothetical protein
MFTGFNTGAKKLNRKIILDFMVIASKTCKAFLSKKYDFYRFTGLKIIK